MEATGFFYASADVSRMRDETPPWVDTVDDPAPSTVDPRVLVATGLWLAAFGWYVILQATPAFGLSAVAAGLVYASLTFAAGVGFGWGEDQVAGVLRAVLDRQTAALGGAAVASAACSWFLLATPANPYAGGLWLGVALLGAGLVVGAALR